MRLSIGIWKGVKYYFNPGTFIFYSIIKRLLCSLYSSLLLYSLYSSLFSTSPHLKLPILEASAWLKARWLTALKALAKNYVSPSERLWQQWLWQKLLSSFFLKSFTWDHFVVSDELLIFNICKYSRKKLNTSLVKSYWVTLEYGDI